MPSFVDTNVLLYAEDSQAGSKRDAAQRLVVDLWKAREGTLSVQVLQELYHNLTRKLSQPVPPAKARQLLEDYMAWPVVTNTPELLRAALDVEQRYKLSFWDALIVQAALEAGCDRLYSEDLNAGQKFGGLTVVNPFA